MTPLHVPMPTGVGWCAACGEMWPCETKRRQLTAEYDRCPVSLGLLMGSLLMDAMKNAPDERAGDLYERFVGWIGPYRKRRDRPKW